jgi:hypothetical protein
MYTVQYIFFKKKYAFCYVDSVHPRFTLSANFPEKNYREKKNVLLKGIEWISIKFQKNAPATIVLV